MNNRIKKVNIIWKIIKPMVVHPFSEIQVSTQKKETTDTWYNLDKSWRYFAERKKPGANDCILSDSFIWHSEEDKNLGRLGQRTDKWLGGRGVKNEGRVWLQKIFWRVMELFWILIMTVFIQIYTCFKICSPSHQKEISIMWYY